MNDITVSQISDFVLNDLQDKGFKAYKVETHVNPVPFFGRRDYYKICLSTGKSLIDYSDRSVEVEGTTLFFGNPHVPYSSQILSERLTGWACLFTEEFLKVNERHGSLQESPLFKLGGSPVVSVNDLDKKFLSTLFEKLIEEQQRDYVHKNDLVRSYIHLLIQEALKMNPLDDLFKSKNAASRITFLFLDILEQQFLTERSNKTFKLRTAQDFAKHLSVHVNYLNRSVKGVKGKTTTTHIAERIITEAKVLLQHTDWPIADIAYTLGFDSPTYFNNFFKKTTGTIPKMFRGKVIVGKKV
jgi:AraC family transcriptional activator of pobA